MLILALFANNDIKTNMPQSIFSAERARKSKRD
jgi:hypothetical protein